MSLDGKRSWTVVGAVAVVVALVAVGAWWFADRPNPLSSANGSENGNVVSYDGRTYWVSGERVADTSLGSPVAAQGMHQGAAADLREVQGFPADEVLAAYLPAQRAGQTGPGWTFVAVDQSLGTNPLADPSASAVLVR